MRGQLRGLEAACAGEVHAALVARLATLETEHVALVRDADAQRRQYERCLDDVANQVVRALLSQKVHLPMLVFFFFQLIICWTIKNVFNIDMNIYNCCRNFGYFK